MEIIVCYGCQVEITTYVTYKRLSEPEFCESCDRLLNRWQREHEENLEDMFYE